MKTEHLQILMNIIAAVESGGQKYGNRRYDAYAGAGENSIKEVTCTLGFMQYYGTQAQELVLRILLADAKAFNEADTANIKSKVAGKWVDDKWNPSEEEKEALIRIITTDVGKKIQEEMCIELLEKYLRYAHDYDPVMSVQAQMMWAEIEHLGGLNAVKRIFDKTPEPYTVDGIMESLLRDQNDPSSNNQVGDLIYWSRHEKCSKWIKEYVEKEVTNMGVTEKQVLDIARGLIGMDRATGTHKPIIDGYNSHKPLARGYAVKYSDEYCDTTISYLFIKAGDVSAIGGTECGVEEHVKLFKSAGIWEENGNITPKEGYIIVYNWDKATQPNDGYSDHIGIVEKVSGNQITVIEGNMNGKVGRRTIPIGWGYIRGYAKPKYKIETVTATAVSSEKLQEAIGIVTAKEDMNLRMSSANNGALVTSVTKGTTLPYLGDAANGWLEVEYEGKKVYTSDVNSNGTKGVHWTKYKVPDEFVSIVRALTTKQLKQGVSGKHVRILQRTLNNLISAGLVVDGDFGKLTYAAVIKFQKLYGIKQTGIVDFATVCMMLKVA